MTVCRYTHNEKCGYIGFRFWVRFERMYNTSDILMISPLLRQSFLLSSSTVFMLSIHRVSTGPSNMNHFLSGVSFATPCLMRQAIIPSVLESKKKVSVAMYTLIRRQPTYYYILQGIFSTQKKYRPTIRGLL